METNVTDEDVTNAIKNINQDLLPRRINFVPAKFEYKMQINDSIVYATSTEYYSICYGKTKNSSSNDRPTLYDPNKLAQIKNWSIRYHPGNGYSDLSNRGFATSVLYCLRACPCFRQFQDFHTEFCKRVGCNLCKIYKFFRETENYASMIDFPLDLNVFDRKWTIGTPGDSAEFLNQLLNVLQREEFSSSRSFQTVDIYSTAIGQMFRIESQNELICRECGRKRIIKDSYWTYFLQNRIDRSSLVSSIPIPVDDYLCDACNEPVSCIEKFIGELPLIFTIQMNNWDDKKQFKRKQFQAQKYLKLTISEVKYRLVAFTDYNGTSSEGGKFNSIFLSSSGTWNSMINGKIQSIDINSLSKYNPQLLFYSRDEPNANAEKASITRIQQQQMQSKIFNETNDNEEEDNSDAEDYNENANRMKFAKDALTKSIEKQLKRNLHQNMDKSPANDIVVVDTTDIKSRKVDRKKVTSNPSNNPMQMLLKKSRNVHETSAWDGIEVNKDERKESAGGWKEEAPDEWDQNLDKGHVRKVKSKRPPPIENPFDKAVSQKRTPDDIWKEKKKIKNKNKFDGKKRFYGNKPKKDKKP